MDLGVVQDERRDPEGAGDGATHVEAAPRLEQLGDHGRPRSGAGHVVRGGDHDAVPDHAGHAHRHAGRGGKGAGEVGDRGDQTFRG